MQDERIFLIIVGIVILFAIIYLQENNGKSRVKAYLEHKGCQQINIRTRLFTGSRGTISFEVEYLGKNGMRQKNTCIVYKGLFSDDKIYWEKPLT